VSARRLSLGALAVVAACAKDGSAPSVFLDPLPFELARAGDDDLLVLKLEAYGQGEVYLQSAQVTVQARDGERVYTAPELVAPLAPIDFGELDSETIELRVPSPFSSPPIVDDHCLRAGLGATVTLGFYSPDTDDGRGDAPLLGSATATLSLQLPGLPEPPAVFGSVRLDEPPVSGEAELVRFSSGSETASLALLEDGGRFTIFEVNAVGSQLGLERQLGFGEAPPAFAALGSGLYALGSAEPGVRVSIEQRGVSSFDWGTSLEVLPRSEPEYDALRVQGIYLGPDGTIDAVVQSAFALREPTLAVDLSPPPGKYFGTSILRLAADGTPLSFEPSDRDILHLERFPTGSIRVSSELPPAEASQALRIEGFDDAGAVQFTHEEPVRATRVAFSRGDDGSFALAFTDAFFGDLLRVVVFGADGQVRTRFSASGSTPSVTITGDGRVLVAFTGSLPTTDGLPSRSVPLLAELDPSGVVFRAQQIGCGGVLAVARGAEPLLAANVESFATLGDAVLGSFEDTAFVVTGSIE
jgi:hypothetical protein